MPQVSFVVDFSRSRSASMQSFRSTASMSRIRCELCSYIVQVGSSSYSSIAKKGRTIDSLSIRFRRHIRSHRSQRVAIVSARHTRANASSSARRNGRCTGVSCVDLRLLTRSLTHSLVCSFIALALACLPSHSNARTISTTDAHSTHTIAIIQHDVTLDDDGSSDSSRVERGGGVSRRAQIDSHQQC